MSESPRSTFRTLVAMDRCLVPASVFDSLSARAAADLGYETAMLAGSTASAAILAEGDHALITSTELAEQTRRITRSAGLPLIVDADHGYGNPSNVARTVVELDQAGAAALTIEDTDLPPPFGRSGNSLVPLEQGRAKMRAALAGRRDPALMIVARTTILSSVPLSETLDRVAAYSALAVDAIFVSGVRDAEQLAAVSAATPLPLMLGSVPDALIDPGALAERRVRICGLGHHGIAAATAALHETLRRQRDCALAGRPYRPEASREIYERLTSRDSLSIFNQPSIEENKNRNRI